MNRINDTTIWYLTYVLFPCSPFFISALIHIFVSPTPISVDTFNASSLSMSLGLSSFVILQNILNKEIVLENEEKKRTQKFYSLCYLIGSILFIACFGVFEGVTDYSPKDGDIKIKLEILIFTLFVVYSFISNGVQKRLKLETKLFWDSL